MAHPETIEKIEYELATSLSGRELERLLADQEPEELEDIYVIKTNR